jgi:hypothetical protein
MILSILGCLLFVVAILWLCFLMDRQRSFQQGYKDGYRAAERDAAEWLRAEVHSKTAERI